MCGGRFPAVACAESPQVQLHVVPLDAPSYPGLDGPFTIADMPDGSRVAHVDSPGLAVGRGSPTAL